MILAQFFAPGRPRTKGSLRGRCLRDKGHTVVMEEDIEMSKLWRRSVASAGRHHQMQRYGHLLKHEGPVEVFLGFFFEREMGVVGGERTTIPIPSHATQRPTHITLGDGDKLTRNVFDALSAPGPKSRRAHLPYLSGLIMDDSQITDWTGRKHWADATHPAGVHVLVMEASSPEVSLAAQDQLFRVMALGAMPPACRARRDIAAHVCDDCMGTAPKPTGGES